MTEVLVLCPTRGRPGAALEVQTSFDTTRTGQSRLLFVVDHDDPQREEYEQLSQSALNVMFLEDMDPPSNMVKALNGAAGVVLGLPDAPLVLGFIGDDHRFRSHGWDQSVMRHVERIGAAMVYGNDKAHSDPHLPESELLPTFIFISSSIVAALGYMALPACRHLYVDDAWKRIGKAIDKLVYDPSIVVEHMHPAYGKAEWDEGHKRVNSDEMYGHDHAAFEGWLADGFEADVERVKAIL